LPAIQSGSPLLMFAEDGEDTLVRPAQFGLVELFLVPVNSDLMDLPVQSQAKLS
jgi:hypothetical protein